MSADRTQRGHEMNHSLSQCQSLYEKYNILVSVSASAEWLFSFAAPFSTKLI